MDLFGVPPALDNTLSALFIVFGSFFLLVYLVLHKSHWAYVFMVGIGTAGVALVIFVRDLPTGGNASAQPSIEPTSSAIVVTVTPTSSATSAVVAPIPQPTAFSTATPDVVISPSPVQRRFIVITSGNDNLFLRAEATRTARIAERIPPGTRLDVTGLPMQAEDLVWWPVSSPNGNEGWVAELAPDGYRNIKPSFERDETVRVIYNRGPAPLRDVTTPACDEIGNVFEEDELVINDGPTTQCDLKGLE